MSKRQKSSGESDEKNISWTIPEYDKHERRKQWYVASVIIALALLIYSVFTSNFLFAIIIIIGAFIIMAHDGQEPMKIIFSITEEGLQVGKKFYDYDIIKDFSIVYKPHVRAKNLYFEFKNAMRPRLSIPLENMDPLPIRENLLKYLTEDIKRTDLPLSEALAKMFKL